MTMANASAQLEAILPGGAQHGRIMADYDELRRLIGEAGVSNRFAARMVESLREDRK